MNYSGIIYDDIANGVGIRTSLFVSGCRNNCPGCFNTEAQNFNYGEEYTKDVEDKILESINDEYRTGITILGGDPLEPENSNRLVVLAERFREQYGNSKTIWMYTGYIYEDILNLDEDDSRRKLLLMVDVLVDGPFILSEKDITLAFKGSRNQRVIDVKKSISEGHPHIIG